MTIPFLQCIHVVGSLVLRAGLAVVCVGGAGRLCHVTGHPPLPAPAPQRSSMRIIKLARLYWFSFSISVSRKRPNLPYYM